MDETIPCPNCGSTNPVNYIDESLCVQPAVVVHKSNGGSVKAVVVRGAIAVIGINVASLFANGYALGKLQFLARDVSEL
jgi:hypothetical protein